jgi:hypothetical protein
VRRIESGAFENNEHIVHIALPRTVTAIGQRAFANCANLTGVTIPASVTAIGDNAFRDNPKLAYARFEHNQASNIVTFGNRVFDHHGTTFFIFYPRNATGFTQPSWQGYASRQDPVALIDFDITTANGQVTINKFNGSASHVDIPSHIDGHPVVRINNSAFAGNTTITSVILPPTVTAIGAQAFEHCSNLRYLVIPGSVTSIGFRAFSHCTSLTNVIIPQSVTTIENGAFADCSRLVAAKFEHANANTITTFGDHVFGNAASDFKIHHNEGAVGFTLPRWRGYDVADNNAPEEPEEPETPEVPEVPEPPAPPTPTIPTTASSSAIQLRALAGGQPTTNARAVPVNFRVLFNGVPRQMSNAILNVDGTTYLPLRALGEDLLGAAVVWDQANSMAILVYNNTVVETFAGSNQVVVDGSYRAIMPGAPEQRVFITPDGSMYVPIRAISEAFGLLVNWEATTQTILLNE